MVRALLNSRIPPVVVVSAKARLEGYHRTPPTETGCRTIGSHIYKKRGLPLKRHRHLIFGIVAMAQLMAAIDSTMVSVALKSIQTELNVSLALAGWTITAYLLTVTIVLPVAGRLGDQFDRKKLFLLAVGLFTIGSSAATVAPNIYFLVLCRITQSVGGGAFIPLAIGIISETYKERRQTAVGFFNTIFPIGALLGPNIGGAIVDHLSWRWIFVINVPIGLLVLLLSLRFMPSIPSTAKPRPFDTKGLALFAGGIILTLTGLSTLAKSPDDITSTTVWTMVGTGLVLLVLFVRHQRRTPSPLIELGLLKSKQFMAANVYGFVMGFTILGFFSFIPYYAITAFDMTASQSAIILTPRSAGIAISAAAASLLLVRFGYRRPIIFGFSLFAIGILLVSLNLRNLSVMGWEIPNGLLLTLEVLLGGIGIGIATPASQNAALNVYPDKISAAAGVRGMINNTGAAMGSTSIILALSLYDDKAVGLRHIFLVLSFIVAASLPFAFFIADRAPGKKET